MTQDPKIAEIIAKACADKSYLDALVANPNQVLKDAGVALEPDVVINVLVNTDKVKHLVVPNINASGIAGGHCSPLMLPG